MSTADAAWLRMDRPTNLMVVNSVRFVAGNELSPAVEAAVGDLSRELAARLGKPAGAPRAVPDGELPKRS